MVIRSILKTGLWPLNCKSSLNQKSYFNEKTKMNKQKTTREVDISQISWVLPGLEVVRDASAHLRQDNSLSWWGRARLQRERRMKTQMPLFGKNVYYGKFQPCKSTQMLCQAQIPSEGGSGTINHDRLCGKWKFPVCWGHLGCKFRARVCLPAPAPPPPIGPS